MLGAVSPFETVVTVVTARFTIASARRRSTPTSSHHDRQP
jgi:hypothetical protein